MANKKDNYSHIDLRIKLDDQKIPVEIDWKSDDPNAKEYQSCKAFSLSLFDKDHRDTLKIDLWTKDFQVSEMDRFMYNTLKGLCDSYIRATNNTELANEMRKFAQYFGEKTEIIKKE